MAKSAVQLFSDCQWSSDEVANCETLAFTFSAVYAICSECIKATFRLLSLIRVSNCLNLLW